MIKANLNRAHMKYAVLSGCDLSEAHLNYADLSYAFLHNADLSYADLSYADLMRADLRHTYIGYTNLNGAVIDIVNKDIIDPSTEGYSSIRWVSEDESYPPFY